jgi:hypothetical protein
MEIDREKLVGESDGEMTLYVLEGRIGAATIVSFPAFPSAVIALGEMDLPPADENGRGESITEAARSHEQDVAICSEECGDDENCMHDCMEKKSKKYAEDSEEFANRQHTLPTPFAVTNSPWDGATSRFSDTEWKRATAGCRGSDAPAKSDCFLPHHEPGGAVSRAGVHAAAARFNQVTAPSPAKARARSHLASHYRNDLKEKPPSVLMAAALVAHAEKPGPPASWFEDPQLKDLTPLTISRDGRIYGHVAGFNSCHASYKQCVRPPRSKTSYAHFLVGQVFASGCDCEDGIPTGVLSMSTGHADLYATPDRARSHYDNTGTAVADVACGEDAHGIWIAGALRPGLTDAQLRMLRGSVPSGDWRPIGGNLELVAVLLVNTPGYVVPRVAAGFDCGVQVSLVAAGVPEEETAESPNGSGADVNELLEELRKEKVEKAEEEKVEPEPESAPSE